MTENQRARLEQRYRRLFERFNRRVFANRLPHYCVVVHYPMYQVNGVPVAGKCHKKDHRIELTAVPLPAGQGLLIHEMVHAAVGGDHGCRFRAEMTRLYEAGAPFHATDVAEYIDDNS
jgi:hypothetical protein